MSVYRIAILLTVLLLSNVCRADELRETIEPFLKKHCVRCHSAQKPRGELDVTRYRSVADVVGDFREWETIVEFVREGEMPPPDEEQQPTLDERRDVTAAIEAILRVEAEKNAGDPGIVRARRLSRAEYDASIHDLTGVDIRPTANWPADPAGGEGFDNTGEALAMSPSLLQKSLEAADQVASHLVLRTDGFRFAPFPVTSYNERKKLAEQAVIDFYREHEVDVADYLEAAWQYRYRPAADRNVTVEDWARRLDLSPRYLTLVWSTLESPGDDATGHVAEIAADWRSLPAPKAERASDEFATFARKVEFVRERLGYARQQLIKSNAGNWPIGHLDFRAKVSANRDRYDADSLRSEIFVRFDKIRRPKKETDPRPTLRLRITPAFEGAGRGYILLERPVVSRSGNRSKNEKDIAKNQEVSLRSVLERHAPDVARSLAFGKHPAGGEIDADSCVLRAPADIAIPLEGKLLDALDDRHVLVDVRLDLEHSPDAAVQLQHRLREELPETPERAALLIDADGQLAKSLAASADRFCKAFPNRFYYVDDRRGLAAGFHLVEGFYRDDRPLVDKVLSDAERTELDRLWAELDFATASAETLLRGFVWFERSERHVLQDERFDFLRPEDPELVTPAMLDRFERVYLEKLGVKLETDSTKPLNPDDAKYAMIHGFFEDVRRGLATHRSRLETAEEFALRDLAAFAVQAFGRDLRPGEWDSYRGLYDSLRKRGQDVEPAIRGTLTAVLVSPDFLFRYHATPDRAAVNERPLTDHELASRLSHFLWSSVPDAELRGAADSGQLLDEAELVAQTRRMLRSPRASRFAREFLGQWLRYRDFLDKDPINAAAFPGYDDELRTAMFEEPTRLATWLIRENRPITDLLDSDVTFVNDRLAKHYGGEVSRAFQRGSVENPSDDWRRIDGLRESGRGGLFGMAVVLAKNSAGERTSPVKRGFWTVHHLLGQPFPPPPADVPELPASEKAATATIRELLALHAADAQCNMCHRHFDGLGLALEGFDPIGRSRTKDAAGREIDDAATLPTGKVAEGIGGLIDYVEQERKRDFVRTFCRKFLGYALGRSVLLSDQPLLDEMEAALEANEYRFGVVFETVVRSRQFRHRRSEND